MDDWPRANRFGAFDLAEPSVSMEDQGVTSYTEAGPDALGRRDGGMVARPPVVIGRLADRQSRSFASAIRTASGIVAI
jgi:hypothetical protein